jgi:hypothetical protein
MTRVLSTWTFAAAAAASSLASTALAGDFDETGRYVVDPAAAAFESCEAPVAYIQDDAEPLCTVSHAEPVLGAPDALEGDSYVRVKSPGECIERFTLFGDGDLVPEVAPAPNEKASYRMTAWMRHGSAGGRFVVRYTEDDVLVARLAPTGRATSDGWIELESNPVPIDGTRKPLVYLRFTEFAAEDGVDLDAIELVRAGDFREQPTCSGVDDDVCGPGAICVAGQCRLGALSVPPLPRDEIRAEMVASMRALIETFYGGRNTRVSFLPSALATFDEASLSDDAWTFWNGWATAIRRLHDWHTSANSSFLEGAIGPGLNVCFIEGDADRSQFIAPKHPVYPDVLVSHTGTSGTAGLSRGDRLVAVDGRHPIEWAQSLDDVNWSFHPPCDPESYSDYVEDLGRAFGLIARYAKNFTVVRCDVISGTCSDELETIAVADLPPASGQEVGCDNRPFYHLANNPGPSHAVGFSFFQGPILDTTPEEAIYGMVWDTLYGGGDPNGYVNGILRAAVTDWKANARGVILDHRAGSGGTLDAPQYVTELVRPRETWAVTLMPTYLGAWNGPETPAEGLELFQRFQGVAPYVVGSVDHDPDLPVAMLTHRDGSASDYLPEGMKGAPKTRLFGPGPTAGAFSTFIQFSYWGGISFQLASGDTIRKDGTPLIGRGVVPDEIVEQKQSDLLAGKDSIHEAALAWVRSELKQP